MIELSYVSLFSGIEAFSVAASRVEGVRWNPVFFSEIDPFPCAVLAHHFPQVPNLGDICKIRVEGKNVTNGDATIPLPERGIDILAGGSPCFVAGTMVLTPKGYVPIETLRVGDEIVGGSGEVRKVEAVGSRMAEVGKFKVLGRPEITCTPNHPFMCISMKRDNCRNSPTYARKIPVSGYVATRADEAIGKYVGRINSAAVHVPTFPKCYYATQEDIVELAGWYLGDGYIRRFTGKTKKTVMFALCRPEKIEQFKARFRGIINFCETGDGKIAVSSTALANWLSEHFGEGALNKRLPYWCYFPLQAMWLLAGYRATDGCHTEGGTKYVTVSKALAYGIADILGDASVHVCHVPPKGNICGRIVNQHDWYGVVKADNGGIRTRRVNGRYASIVRNYGTTGTVQRVYNITVGEDHTYIAEGLWTHNCQDVSVAGKRAGMEAGSGTRSSLAFEYARLVRELAPRILLWENVPGVLSSNRGLDFAAFLRSLDELGYSDLAYAVLDAQFVRSESFPRGVPQRRRRVWVVGVRTVGRAGADFPVAASILSLFPRVCRNHPPRRQAGQGFACPAGYCATGNDSMVGGAGGDGFDLQAFGKYGSGGGASTLKSRDWKDATDLAVQTTPMSPEASAPPTARVRTDRTSGSSCAFDAQSLRILCDFVEDEFGGTDCATNEGERYDALVARARGGCDIATLEKLANIVIDELDRTDGEEIAAAYRALEFCRKCAVVPASCNSNGGQVMETLNTRTGRTPGISAQSDNNGGYVISLGFDARNTGLYGAGATGVEVSMTQDANQYKGGKAVVQGVNCLTPEQPQAHKVYGVDGAMPTLPAQSSGGQNQQAVLVTNSNGEDVAPSITASEYKGAQAQKDKGGGYVVHELRDVRHGGGSLGVPLGQAGAGHDDCEGGK